MTKPRKNSKSKATGQTAAKGDASGGPEKIEAIDAGGGHIDQIRDILFGRQMADYEERFQQLENRIASLIDTLRLETEKRIEAMSDLMQKQSEALTRQLKTEVSKRGQAEKTLHKEIAEAEQSLSSAIDALSAQQTQDAQTLGDRLGTLSRELSDELHIQQVETSKNLEQAVQALDDAKLARATLSQMLIEMAGQLSDPRQ